MAEGPTILITDIETDETELLPTTPLVPEPTTELISKEDSFPVPSITVTVPEAPQLAEDDKRSSLQGGKQGRSYLPPLVSEFYRGKTVLLTGSTGFIGKAILWKLISSLGRDINKIYILIRNGSNKRKMGRPNDRLKSEILCNKAFTNLRRQMGTQTFDAIIAAKVIPIACDLVAPALGISPDDRKMLIEDVNVVIHCAATMDFNERLDQSLEVNTLGTLRLMDLADDCKHVDAFIHLSSAYLNANIPDGPVGERVYPMLVGEPEDLLKEIVALELEEIPKMTQRVMAYYPNTYTFTKALTEHLILKRVDFNRTEERQGGKKQWPIAIIRASQIGGAVKEPLVGWADGMTGANGIVLFTGRGVQAFLPGQGDTPADVVPVDYFVRAIIGSAAHMKPPGTEFMLPYAENPDGSITVYASPIPPSPRSPISIPQGQPQKPDPNAPKQYFPIIQQVTATTLSAIKWRQAYDIIRQYWTRTTKVNIPPSSDYFVSSKAMFKARFFMKYQVPHSFASLAHAVVGGEGLGKNVQKMSKMVELAGKMTEALEPFLTHSWVFDDNSINMLRAHLSTDPDFNFNIVDHILWDKYFMDLNYGVHYFVSQEPSVRTLSVPFGWDCALYSRSKIANSAPDKMVVSAIYTQAEIKTREDALVSYLVEAFGKPGIKDKTKDVTWQSDLDASLEDWCNDENALGQGEELGKWRQKVGDNDEAVTVVVLNDKRVGAALQQIQQKSGVGQQKAIEEALKVLRRMRERTQLAYIHFAATFLKTTLQRMFESIRVREEDITKLKQLIVNKRVIYVPTSKTLIDSVLIWYVVIRYGLPVPAIACDEALMTLGPIADIMRLAGAYFIKRDTATRSPLNTAVTAAYTQVLLREHGALAFTLEKARSRTGKTQDAHPDGLVNMVIEAALETNQTANHLAATEELMSPLTPNGHSVIQRDVIFVPINVTYERIPELSVLTDEVLDQRMRTPNAKLLTIPSGITAPSQARETRIQRTGGGSELTDDAKLGRVFFGIGKVISLREVAEDDKLQKSIAFDTIKGQGKVANKIIELIQKAQRETITVSPVSLVAAVVLFSRISGGLQLGRIKDVLEWLRRELKSKNIALDWQDGEDIDAIIQYSVRILDEKNIIIDNKDSGDESHVRPNDHADNIMTLAYHANQIIDIFLPEALLATVYLSYNSKTVMQADLLDRFKFLLQLLDKEFVFPWDMEEKFKEILNSFLEREILAISADEDFKGYVRAVDISSNPSQYTQLLFLASLLYPTIDAYWITACSLSALETVPLLPKKTVPVLSQWIATHLISGRRTIYREVLSTETSRNAVEIFMSMGFVRVVNLREKLSPDAQSVLHDLGISTQEDLIEMGSTTNSEKNADAEAKDEIAILMAQIESNRATIGIQDLSQQIESYRFGAADSSNQFQNAQVFSKCQKQIKSILKTEETLAKKKGLDIPANEEDMIQLVFSLKQASASPIEGSPRGQRRVSEVYNLSHRMNLNALNGPIG